MGDGRFLRIGELARRASVRVDTIRYYERIGLLRPKLRSPAGYRLYDEADLGRLIFIKRAKQLGLSLREVGELLEVAGAGDCGQTRRHVAEALRRKIEECQRRLTELLAFKQSLEECYGLLVAQKEACGGCTGFPADCGCLPVGRPLTLEQAPGCKVGLETILGGREMTGTEKDQPKKVWPTAGGHRSQAQGKARVPASRGRKGEELPVGNCECGCQGVGCECGCTCCG